MEAREVQDYPSSQCPDSFTSLFSAIQLTSLRIALHALAAAGLTLRLPALPIVFAYRAYARRAAPLLHILESIVNSPSRTIRNLYRLYHVISSQPQIVELAESSGPSVDDAVSVETILLKRFGVQEYHESSHEVRPRDSLEIGPSFPPAADGFAPELYQNATMPSSCEGQLVASPVGDMPRDGNRCRECLHERLGCVTCTHAARSPSVDTRTPKKAKLESEFRYSPSATNEERFKLPFRQAQVKKSGKLQKRVARY